MGDIKFLSKIKYFPDRPTRLSGPYVTGTKQLFCHGLMRQVHDYSLYYTYKTVYRISTIINYDNEHSTAHYVTSWHSEKALPVSRSIHWRSCLVMSRSCAVVHEKDHACSVSSIVISSNQSIRCFLLHQNPLSLCKVTWKFPSDFTATFCSSDYRSQNLSMEYIGLHQHRFSSRY